MLCLQKKGHKIADCPKEETMKQVCQNQMVWFGKLDGPISVENTRTFGQCNKGVKVAFEKYMSKNENTKRQSKDKASTIKHQTCYTCCDKGHLSKDCPKTQTFIHMVVNDDISHVRPKNDTSTIMMISSPCDSPHAIWVPKHLLTNHEGPNKAWVPKLAWSSYRWLEMHWKLDNQQEDGIITILSSVANFDPMQSQGQDKCLSLYLNLAYVSLPCSLTE
jgi:hypothetical protein